MTNAYEWQRSYEAAILETNRSRLPELIKTAQAAIDARVEALRADREGGPDEQRALADALSGLRILKEEIGHS